MYIIERVPQRTSAGMASRLRTHEVNAVTPQVNSMFDSGLAADPTPSSSVPPIRQRPPAYPGRLFGPTIG